MNARNVSLAALKNLALLIIAWLVPFGANMLHLTTTRMSRNTLLLAVLISISIVAYTVRARGAFWILSVCGTAFGVETLVWLVYGNHFDFQGFPRHVGLLVAAAVGLLLGRVTLRLRPDTPTPRRAV
jgi:hypothetical protein